MREAGERSGRESWRVSAAKEVSLDAAVAAVLLQMSPLGHKKILWQKFH